MTQFPYQIDESAGIEEARTRAEAEEKQRQIDYRITFSAAEGSRVIADLVEFCGFWRTTHHREPGEAAFLEGQRNVMLYILAQLTPELRNKLLGG